MRITYDWESFRMAVASRVPNELLTTAIWMVGGKADAIGWTGIRIDFGRFMHQGSDPNDHTRMQLVVYRDDPGQPERSIFVNLVDGGDKVVTDEAGRQWGIDIRMPGSMFA